uniref:MULE transposase domain-containing protein n=1 Tax=Octopus bimaculoides TaxID=37653 RepID=A0A0L8FQE2_OCTBM
MRKNFLRYESGPCENRILLFSTEKNMRLLQSSSDWFCDGTFQVVPELFHQLCSIHRLISNRTILCFFALSPNKRQATFGELFSQFQALYSRFNPANILINYEQTAKNAITDIFPNAIMKGCFFHHSQAVCRKNVAADEIPLSISPGVLTFLPVRRLNMCDRVCNDLPRTVNSLEGLHDHVQANVTSSHPNIWCSHLVLKTEQAFNDMIINQMLVGHQPSPEKKKISRFNEKNCKYRGGL